MKRMITNRKVTEFLVLTCDPSLTAWGWVIVRLRDDLIVDKGCIKTEPQHKKLRTRVGDDRCRRISELNKQLLHKVKMFKVGYIVSEQPHGSQSAVSAVMVGITLGVMQTMADVLNIGIEWYSEADAKKALLGKKAAVKKETINAINKLYKVDWKGVKYVDEAVADAMAVYHAAVQQSPALKMIKANEQRLYNS